MYIISGPPGVGKSSVSNELAYMYEKSAVISGDSMYLMVKGGLVAPWDDDGYYMELFWDNVINVTSNFLDRELTVIIEYVLFEEQLEQIKTFLKTRQVNLKYCVLLAKEQTLRARDSAREGIEQTGELSIQSCNEFLAKKIVEKHILYTDHLTIEETATIVKSSDRFLM